MQSAKKGGGYFASREKGGVADHGSARWHQRYAQERDKKLKGVSLKLQSKRSPGERWKDLT
jgi:hypothetical protein